MIQQPLFLNQIADLKFLTEQNGKPCHKHILNGREVPGCTSISGLFQDDGWKFAWPVKLMYEHAMDRFEKELSATPEMSQIEGILRSAKFAWKKKRDKSADTGTTAHRMVEEWIKAGIIPPKSGNAEITNIIAEFFKWVEIEKPEFRASEVQVCSVVHQFAGILDVFAYIPRLGNVLIDIKTSKDIKADYWVQLAGLRICLEEMGVTVDAQAILHLPKEGNYEFRVDQTTLAEEREDFVSALPFYARKNLFLTRYKQKKEAA